MNTWISLIILLAFCANASGDDAPKKTRPKFTIGKETTYVTGPIDKDGYIDYVAALNERLGTGTAENNANVLIWKAVGPWPGPGPVPAGYFKLMGIEEAPKQGDYFIDRGKFATEQLKIDAAESMRFVDECGLASERPWAAREHPRVAAWLKANERPLATVVEATKRTHYFNPLVPVKRGNGAAVLIEAPLPTLNKSREWAQAFACRAMHSIAEKRYDDAWQDLLACHRLGRQLGRGASLIEALVGIAIDTIASKRELVLLDRAGFDVPKLRKCLDELRALPSLPAIAEKIDLSERMTLLQIVMHVERHGPQFLESLSGGSSAKRDDPLVTLALQDVNWDPAFQNVNRWYDRLAAAAREPDRALRTKQMNQVGDDLRKLKRDFNGAPEIAKAILDGKAVPETKGRAIGDILIFLLLPATDKVQQARDRNEQIEHNLHIAFALAAYQRDHGRYPTAFEDLAPKYLAKVPNDYFTDKPLTYRPNEKGYLLYSFGPNGKDDGGQWTDDVPPGDDPSVRMPIPERRRK